ncbi:2-hydroxyacid dehydrogenase [Alteribacillus sp. HJP-4]|uniref:2-hydroxyacid dehydrogenase n=1 Tax=Alteribacillus sp. HJP-4 TaxID=2775394 RepID=UPI0035CD0920
MPTILSYVEPPEDVLSMMKETCEVIVERPKHKEAFEEALQKADGLYGSGLQVNAELLQKAPQLKVVSNVSVGYDNLNIEDIYKQGVIATHTPTVLIDTMADTMMGLMLATARRMPEMDRLVREGKWVKPTSPEWFGVNVSRKKLGIIGMGRIGEEVARRAGIGFHMDVVYYNRRQRPDAEERCGASYAELDDLLKTCDFVMVLTPLTEQTKHLIGAREFELMKKDAIFLNGGRGPVVVENDLVKALQKGDILAAGLDVFDREPLGEKSPFQELDNVVTLPHIGTATHETRHAMFVDAAEQCVDGVHGRTPAHVIPG